MSAELLRRAATVLREAAGPCQNWHRHRSYRIRSEPNEPDLALFKFALDAEYAALMHPPVGLAVADLLVAFTMMPSASDPTDFAAAVALARTILREPTEGGAR